jgi:hypothetical protein
MGFHSGFGFGFGFGLGLVWVWFGFGLGLVWVWFGFGLGFGFAFVGIPSLPLRRHPLYVSSLHASPLCGAAPTFLCRRKEK